MKKADVLCGAVRDASSSLRRFWADLERQKEPEMAEDEAMQETLLRDALKLAVNKS